MFSGMLEHWRSLLYYPLGLLPSLFFLWRLFIQWWQSEKYRQSYVSPLFWRLTIAGNALLVMHYFIQIQYPFAILHTANTVISWRNLNLIFGKPPYSSYVAVGCLLASLGMVTLCFAVQGYWVIGEYDWIRSPIKLYDTKRHYHGLGWHFLGTFGGALFASRFWVQWWYAERKKKSGLNETFWWLSIVGAGISMVYFIRIQDTVSTLRYSMGIFPYIRNLVLIRQKKLFTE